METTIKKLFKEYAWEYLFIHEGKVPTNHKKVIDAIINCRTEVYGITFYKCESCGKKDGMLIFNLWALVNCRRI